MNKNEMKKIDLSATKRKTKLNINYYMGMYYTDEGFIAKMREITDITRKQCSDRNLSNVAKMIVGEYVKRGRVCDTYTILEWKRVADENGLEYKSNEPTEAFTNPKWMEMLENDLAKAAKELHGLRLDVWGGCSFYGRHCNHKSWRWWFMP